MQIPHAMLKPETLRALVEEFVSRDGTDYGEREVGLSTKIDQVLRQLERGEAVVVFDPESETTSVMTREAFRAMPPPPSTTYENV